MFFFHCMRLISIPRLCLMTISFRNVSVPSSSPLQYLIFQVVRGPFKEDFYQCVTYEFYTAKWQEQMYATFTLIFMFIIPLGILLVTYVSTFRTISGLYFHLIYILYSKYNQRFGEGRFLCSIEWLKVSLLRFNVCWCVQRYFHFPRYRPRILLITAFDVISPKIYSLYGNWITSPCVMEFKV